MEILKYEEWKAFCQRSAKKIFRDVNWFRGTDYYVSGYTEPLKKYLSKSIDYDSKVYSLYMGIGYFFGLEATLEASARDNRDYYNSFYENMSRTYGSYFADTILEYLEIEESKKDGSEVGSIEGRQDESISNLADLRSQFVRETTTKNYKFLARDMEWMAYLWVWKLSTPEMRAEEIKKLQTLGSGAGSAELKLYLQSMDFTNTQLEEKIKLFKIKSFLEMICLLEVSLETNKLEFSRMIIDWALENSPSKITHNSGGITLRNVKTLCQMAEFYSDLAKDDFDKYEEVVLHFMPHTRTEFGGVLLRKGDYKRWVELQSVHSDDPLRYCKNEVRTIAKVAPEVLLPIYHQQIAYEISWKNRESYKQAVKLMKKIRTIYKKINKIDQWNQYVSHIEEKYKRLRAFQEELRKGKIIDSTEDKNPLSADWK